MTLSKLLQIVESHAEYDEPLQLRAEELLSLIREVIALREEVDHLTNHSSAPPATLRPPY